MTNQVFGLRSTLALPLEEVYHFFDNADLPAAIADVDITRRNNTLIIKSIPVADISKYTATAQLKASIAEKRVYKLADGEWSTTPPHLSNNGPQWGDFGEQQAEEGDEEIASQLIEYASFQGTLETVLQNTALQYPMFEVFCDLARHAEQGLLVAIVAVDDQLEAIRIVEGEERPAAIEVVEAPGERDSENGGVWHDNPFINED